ncbi:hypothetical protein C8F04DRAFT_680074 [Mycena alexandri]|uniref:Secreted protein n=1 Tax=Mycena alexandri TaxID=1745969 RepID=A0AAD6TEH2_9AGAR|nr:hypothetical protein C8F04DRAFT_680074 [Mycena alexandri]
MALVICLLHTCSTVRVSEPRTCPMRRENGLVDATTRRCRYGLVYGLERVLRMHRPPHRSPLAGFTAPLPQKWEFSNHTWWFGIKGPPTGDFFPCPTFGYPGVQ